MIVVCHRCTWRTSLFFSSICAAKMCCPSFVMFLLSVSGSLGCFHTWKTTFDFDFLRAYTTCNLYFNIIGVELDC